MIFDVIKTSGVINIDSNFSENEMLLLKKMTKNQDSISEIRVEEVHDHEDGKHFYRVYFHYKNGKIKIMGESKTKPILARYVSEIY